KAARGDALLSRRRLDQGDLRGERATVLGEGREQIGLERDEEVRALLVDGAGAQHAERVRRQGQRVALVTAERKERAASGGGRVRRGAATLVDRLALGQPNAPPMGELQ